MKTMLSAVVALMVLTACDQRPRDSHTADTTITSRKVKDTMVVRRDTVVRVDTVKKTHHGGKP